MSNMITRVYQEYLIPVVEQMFADFRKQQIIHMDETRFKCLELRDEHQMSSIVLGTSGKYEEKQISLYMFSEGKPKTFVNAMLSDEFSGVMMTDGLKAYELYEGNNPEKLNCNAHARRKFYEVMTCRDDYREYLKIARPSCKKPYEAQLVEAFEKSEKFL